MRHPKLRDSIVTTVEEQLGFSKAIVEAANAVSALSTYSDNVEEVLVKSLSDDALHAHLRAEAESAVLFTGGGIMPARLLSIPQLRFIHIHPGHLPSIRGADCLLWSLLLAGRPSATCFFMAPGLDTGDIVRPGWLPRVAIGLAGSEIEQKTQYQAVYAYLDPWVRSFVLRQVLTMSDDFVDVESTPQDDDSSVTFHFMHRKVQAAALGELFSPRS